MNVAALERAVDFCAGLSYEALPAKERMAVKRCILDYLAAASAGYRINAAFNHALLEVSCQMQGKEESSVLMYQKRLPAANAAFMNGAIAHGADMDDGYRTAQGHPGASIISAVLALAEANNSEQADVFPAIVAGYEIFARLGTALNPHHAYSGFHTSGTVGTVAAAAAAGRLMRLSAAQMRHTIGFGCMQAAGLLEVVTNGQQAKVLNTARAAQAGVMSALWAKAGACAPATILDGRQGFLNAFSEDPKRTANAFSFDGQFCISNGYFKSYPSCRHTHGAIDLAIECYRQGEISPDRISSIKVWLYPLGVRLTGSIFEPHDAEEAKFCLRYALSSALVHGNYSLQMLDVAKSMNRSVRQLLPLIQIEEAPELEDKNRGTRLRIEATDGLVFESRLERPRGENPVPLSWEDLAGKFKSCAGENLPVERQDEVISEVENLDYDCSISQLVALMAAI